MLKGKAAVVTGSTSGIEFGIVRACRWGRRSHDQRLRRRRVRVGVPFSVVVLIVCVILVPWLLPL